MLFSGSINATGRNTAVGETHRRIMDKITKSHTGKPAAPLTPEQEEHYAQQLEPYRLDALPQREDVGTPEEERSKHDRTNREESFFKQHRNNIMTATAIVLLASGAIGLYRKFVSPKAKAIHNSFNNDHI